MSLAPSAAPPNALRIWTDGLRIYIELPGHQGPYIQAYDYNEGGLSKAIAILGIHRVDYDYTSRVPWDYLKPSKEPGTHNQRAQASAILKRNGVIK